MGNFGSILATFVTVIAGAAGTYLQIESWRHAGYEMYDTTIGDLERLESAADDPVSMAWSIGVIQQSFTDFTEPCDGPSYEIEFGFLRLPRLCPLTSNQRDLLFRRLQNLECVQLQGSLTRAIDRTTSAADALRITDGIELARNAFDSYERLSCRELVSISGGAWEPEALDDGAEVPEAMVVEGAVQGDGDRARLRDTVGAKAEKVVDVSVLPARLTVHVPESTDQGSADAMVAALSAGLGRSVQVLGPEFESRKITAPALNFLKSRDAGGAEDLLGQINATGALACSVQTVSGLGGAYEWNPAVRPRTFELWLPESCLP